MKNTQIENIMLKMGNHCEESLHQIHNANSVKELANVLFEFIKPCLKKNFPTYDIMKHFKITGEPFGVFVDSRGDFEAKDQNILYGNSDIILRVKPYDVVRIYLKQTSHLKLKIGENAIITVYKFDEATLEIIEGERNKLFIKYEID